MPVSLRQMRQVFSVLFLEVVAVTLALYQSLAGVRTDEAKYLLDIPYPHPPLARGIFHVFETVPYQELGVRILLATLLIQAVWLVANLAKNFTPENRMTLCGLWVFSGSVLFQSGTIMMAPLTALQGLVFVWLFMKMENARPDAVGRGKWKVENYAGFIALFWLASLFTAYQAILYLPIIITLFWRMKLSLVAKVAAVCVPITLMLLYIATSPLAIASFTSAGGQNAALPVAQILQQTVSVALFAGSTVFSVVGILGLFRSKNIALIASFTLVILFLCVSFRAYYAVLFLPLFVGGVVADKSVLRKPALILALQILAAVYIFSVASLSFYKSDAKVVMRTVNQVQTHGAVLIAGGFGHQWQYESVSPVYRYRTDLLAKAKAVVCIEECPNISAYGFYQVNNLPQKVWVRR